MSLRKVNITILVFVVVIFLLVLHHNFLGLSDLLKKELSDSNPLGFQPIDFIPEAPQTLIVKENDKEIPVVLTASEERLGGVIAAVNSIQQNTKSNVAFHIVTLNDTVDHLRSWLSKISLKNVQYRILNFDSGMLAGKVQIDSKMPNSIKPLTFARFYLPNWVPNAEKAIYLDDDVIVQAEILSMEILNHPSYGCPKGCLRTEETYCIRSKMFSKKKTRKCSCLLKKAFGTAEIFVQSSLMTSFLPDDILELYNTPLQPGHAAAFSDDCDSTANKFSVRGAGNQYNYMGFLDYKKELVRKLSIKASTCSFNPGVFVANLTEWKIQNVTKQLEKWMTLNVVEEIYSRTLAGSITTPPLLIVFYKRHSKINPMWNVRHLGSSAGNRYSPQFVKAAKLLHWNGHFKPWGRTASFADVWEKWYIPDPSGKFNLIRRHSEIYTAH